MLGQPKSEKITNPLTTQHSVLDVSISDMQPNENLQTETPRLI